MQAKAVWSAGRYVEQYGTCVGQSLWHEVSRTGNEYLNGQNKMQHVLVASTKKGSSHDTVGGVGVSSVPSAAFTLATIWSFP